MADKPEITENLVNQYVKTSHLTRLYGHMLYFISGLFKLPKNAHIIDCACGSGAFIQVLLQKGFRSVDGFDASIEMVEIARKTTGQDVRHLEAREITKVYPNGTYDAVCISNMLHHLYEKDDFDLFLLGCRDLLKPGGIIVIREPYPTALMRIFTSMSRHPIFCIGFMKSRLNAIRIEADLIERFYDRWIGKHDQVLAAAGLTETLALNWLDSRIVIGRKQ